MYKPAVSSKSIKSAISTKGARSIKLKKLSPKTMLISSLFVLLVGFGIALLFALNTRPASVEVPDDYVFEPNISIAGVDIGGMDKAAVLAALKPKETKLLGAINVTIDVNGKTTQYEAADIGIESNLNEALGEAMLFGQNPSGYQDDKNIMVTKTEGADFRLVPRLNTAKARARLTADTKKLNIAPMDAKVVFDAEKADPITYQAEKKGASVDIPGLISLIQKAVDKQDYSKITAPVKTADPKYTLAAIKNKTVLVATYTSSFAGSGLHGPNRVFNIKKMAGIINGQVIEPGQTWSMNDTAGDRTEPEWKSAPGIENGVYTDQPGGGVCQVSSTLYNAALRAELEIVERKPHTWPSVYIPKGLDATISSGSPDLKLRNNNKMPVYIVANADTKAMTVTVDIYGEPLEHGYKVEMVSKVVSIQLPPKPQVEDRNTDANGDPLDPGESIVAREPHSEIHAKIYKQYIDPKTNKVVRTIYMYETSYSAKPKLYYENPAAPAAPKTEKTAG